MLDVDGMTCWPSMYLLIGFRSILIQQNDGTTGAFDQNWAVYKSGFGDLEGNFWIGNENLHQLTKNGGCTLRVDVWPVNTGTIWLWSEYSKFVIGDEASGYLFGNGAWIGGTLDDALFLSGAQFITKDRGQYSYNIAGWQCGFWFGPYFRVRINCYQLNFMIYSGQWWNLQQSRMSLFCQ